MKKERYAGISTEKYLYSISISVTFLLCGLWHGVGWNFIAWGGLFALYLVIGSLTEKPKKRFYRKTGLITYKTAFNFMQLMITFLLVCFAWIFFRAADLGTAIHMVSQLFSGWSHDPMIVSFRSLKSIMGHNGITMPESGIILILIPCVEFIEFYFRDHTQGKGFLSLPLPLRWAVYYFLVILIFYFGRSETNTFIYFQF
jgi:D-alanyl-lipoteichoic acid acyltransferase DltB (MBOAT superfamily)